MRSTRYRFEGHGIYLPMSVPPEMIPPGLRNRNLRVHYYCGLDYLLSFVDGHWKVDGQADQSLDVKIDETMGSQLMREWSIHQLDMAAETGITVTSLHLEGCCNVTYARTLLVKYGLLPTGRRMVKVLRVDNWYIGADNEVTSDELLGLLRTCEGLEEIWFGGHGISLPLSVPPVMIPPELKYWNTQVHYSPSELDYLLSFEDGQWKVDEQATDPPLDIRIEVEKEYSPLKMKWCLQELKMAEEAGRSVSLGLVKCFSEFDVTNACIVLESDTRLTNLRTVKVLSIAAFGIIELEELQFEGVDFDDLDPDDMDPYQIQRMTDINVTSEELVGLLQTCDRLEEIRFEHPGLRAYLPLSIPPKMIPPELKNRNVRVHCCGLDYLLIIDDGQLTWKKDERVTDQSLDVTMSGMWCNQEHEWSIQQLEMAARAGIAVSCLSFNFKDDLPKLTNESIIPTCESCPELTNLKTVKELYLEGYNDWDHPEPEHRKVTRQKLLGLLQTCETLEKIRIESDIYCLPSSVPAKLIPPILKTRNIEVLFKPDGGLYGVVYQLNWENGQWQDKDGNVYVPKCEEDHSEDGTEDSSPESNSGDETEDSSHGSNSGDETEDSSHGSYSGDETEDTSHGSNSGDETEDSSHGSNSGDETGDSSHESNSGDEMKDSSPESNSGDAACELNRLEGVGQMIKKYEGISKIEALQQHVHENVQKKASEIIKTYFSEEDEDEEESTVPTTTTEGNYRMNTVEALGGSIQL